MKKKLILISVSVFAILIAFGLVWEKNYVEGQINAVGATTVKIDRYSNCKDVVNAGSKDLMVPSNAKQEWCSFIANHPNDATLSQCQVCDWTPETCFCSNCQSTVHWACTDYDVGSCP